MPQCSEYSEFAIRISSFIFALGRHSICMTRFTFESFFPYPTLFLLAQVRALNLHIIKVSPMRQHFRKKILLEFSGKDTQQNLDLQIIMFQVLLKHTARIWKRIIRFWVKQMEEGVCQILLRYMRTKKVILPYLLFPVVSFQGLSQKCQDQFPAAMFRFFKERLVHWFDLYLLAI